MPGTVPAEPPHAPAGFGATRTNPLAPPPTAPAPTLATTLQRRGPEPRRTTPAPAPAAPAAAELTSPAAASAPAPAAPAAAATTAHAAGVWRFAAPAVDTSVPQARHAVRDLMTAQGFGGREHQDLLYGLQLIVSELVTNAVRHAAVLSPQVVVEVALTDTEVRVAVTDDHPYRPQPVDSDENQTGGRGLLLVKSVAAEAGGRAAVDRTPTGGKTVWAALPLPLSR